MGIFFLQFFHGLQNKPRTLKQQTPYTQLEDVDQKELSETVASKTLVLSRRKLTALAGSIFKNSTLKNLYLEGNQLSSLPDSMFTSLPNLVWLDLRNNQIVALPAVIGLHKSLKTLLLEGNPISELPPELGNVITLKGLNLRHCPIRFPPQDIVQQGLQCILQYLRDAIARRPIGAQESHADVPPVEKLQLSELVKSSTKLCEVPQDEKDLQRFRELKEKIILMERAELDYRGPTKEITKASIIPALSLSDTVERKRSEERRRAAVKEFKEKQATVEQRRKDRELLWEWRTKAKMMQDRKTLDYKQQSLTTKSKEKAPEMTMCATKSELGLTNNSDTVAQTGHIRPQRLQRQRSSMSQKQQQEAGETLDLDLKQRIYSHAQKIQERRNKPRGTLEEKIEAEQDMQETRKLQAELLERKLRRNTEYRFTAFTGDTLPSSLDK
ncbi:leucine-rich repeat-containing protein 27-like [Lampris incognitus]|uniref:leucine-rich repeat-containing protein 27-like n=1 Tax=Lampris incognitus TaxID=2546036 RepID=UPI0024B48508|nr:leucine-rich repeat-containing protein 27-like [Lampris incognitus]